MEKEPNERAPPRAKWYVIWFHYQAALLFLGMLVGLAPLAGQFQQQFIPGPWAWLGAIVFAPFIAYALVRVVLHARWLQGHRGWVEPFIAPPMRINCVIMGVGGLLFIAMGLEAAIGGRPALGVGTALGGTWALFFAVCGFLWKRDAVRNRSDVE